jgi:hypothetical protein
MGRLLSGLDCHGMFYRFPPPSSVGRAVAIRHSEDFLCFMPALRG